MRWSIVSILLLACKPAPPEPAAAAQVVHPDLHCPHGTQPAGKAPPMGYEVWCHKAQPNGTWLRHGPSIAWHPNEQRSAVGEYVEGKRAGAWEFFYPTGELQKHGAFIGGVENGVWAHFHPNGAPRSEGEMVDGKEHGPWTYWELDGRFTTGNWILGERDGVWTEHNANAEPTAERVYKAGRMIAMREL